MGAAIALGWVIARPDDHASWSDLIRSAVLAAGAIGAVPAGYVAYRKQQTTESERHDDRRRQQHVEQQAALTNARADTLEQQRRDELVQATVRADAKDYRDRYAAGAAQLGDDKAAVRLAGVYALAQLADEWGHTEPDQRQVCIDVLCACLRMPWPAPTTSSPNRSSSTRRKYNRIMRPTPRPSPTDPHERAEEIQVRAAILRTMATHLSSSHNPDTAWWSNDFDLTGAHLPAGNLSGARIEGVFGVTGVTFSGPIRFEDATFSSVVDFEGATFSEIAGFNGATFAKEVIFDGANFLDDAQFEGAGFFQTARFVGARFSGMTSFASARFSEAVQFDGVAFTGPAGFWRATFAGVASFEAAQFSLDARFDEASFSGIAGFQGVVFSWSAWFGDARFCGIARFEGATFSTAWFERATFSSSVMFQTATFSEPPELTGATIIGDLERPDWTTDKSSSVARSLSSAMNPDSSGG